MTVPEVARPPVGAGMRIEETPESYAQAHAGPHSHIWEAAQTKEMVGLTVAQTFKPAGEI